MADILRTTVTVQYTEEEAQRTSQYLSEQVSHEPVGHETGGLQLAASMADFSQIAEDVNQMVIYVENGDSISIRIGLSGDTLTNMKLFIYDGTAEDFYVKNTDTDPVTIKYTTGTF